MKSTTEKFNVNIKGKGEKVIVFAHGFGCDQNAWRRITTAFEDDHKLVLFDFIGAGKTDVADFDAHKYRHLNGYVDDLIELGNSLQIGQAVFVGHSVSCMIGVLASIRDPGLFRKLILIGPSPCYINDEDYVGGFDQEDMDNLLELMDDDYLLWAKDMAPQIMGNADKPNLGEELAESFCTTDPAIAKSFARVTFLSDNREDLKNVKVETITLQCDQDIIAPLEVGDFIQKNLPGNKLVKLKATGHCPHMSAPEEIIAVLKENL